MKSLLRSPSLAWLALAGLAFGYLIGANLTRIGRIERVTALIEGARADANSPSGYVHSARNLLIPQHTPASQSWIIEAQQMIASGQWSLDQIDYDNAPKGRAVDGAGPYRIWLRLVTAVERMTSNLSAGQAVEKAALHADPSLHFLLCLVAGALVARRFGFAAGSLLVVGLIVLFPLSVTFYPGQPDEHGLALAAILIALLTLISGLQSAGTGRTALGWFIAAGVSTALAVWVEAGTLLPVATGVFLGGFAAFLLSQRELRRKPTARAWRAWGVGGAMLIAAGWLTLRDTGVASFGPNVSALGGHTAADNLADWLARDGLGWPLFAACLPLLLIPFAIWLVCRREISAPAKQILVTTLGPAVILAVFACFQLRWWSSLDVALLPLLVSVVANLPSLAGARTKSIAWRIAVPLIFLPGAVLLWPQQSRQAGADVLNASEARTMIERDLAQWLAKRSPGAIVFAPPNLSSALAYYGGLRVISSAYPGNQEGIALAVRIAGATSVDEVHALVQQREIRYIVLPSWDKVLDEFARIGSANPEKSVITLLRQWLPPRWLRPVPYQLPVIEGFENDSVFVFEVVEPQENAEALARLAEYFIEMNLPDLAAAVSEALAQSFAGDAGALVARAQVALARADTSTLTKVMTALLPAIAEHRDEELTWERRASLALVLAQVKRPDLAQAQVRFCLEQADEEQLRSLNTMSLYRLLVISRVYGISFPDQRLHTAALELLPKELRARLER